MVQMHEVGRALVDAEDDCFIWIHIRRDTDTIPGATLALNADE